MSYINNVPNTIIFYVSNQLNVDPNVFKFYGYKPFSEENYSEICESLSNKYFQSDNSYFLITRCI